MRIHKAIQRKDGSVYCKCDLLPDENVSVSIRYDTRTAICSVCGKEVDVGDLKNEDK